MIRLNPLAVVFFLALAPEAWAASGVVRAQVSYWERNGGFCDLSETGRDCSGAQYTSSSFDTLQRFKRMRIYVVRSSDGGVLGQGVTDSNGTALISWSTPFWEAAPMGSVQIRFENGDGRFSVRTTSGGTVTGTIPSVQLVEGTTSSSPQDVGSWYWGSSSSPSDWSNLYGAAQRGWESLAHSNRMVSNFNNIEFRAFNTDGQNNADTSAGLIRLDTTRRFMQQTVLHEMGHVAEHRARSFRAYINYCYPDQNSSDGCATQGHSFTSTEWRASAFIEGYAEFIGTRAVYFQHAPQPTTCRIAQAACSAFHPNLETTIGASSCSADDGRRELNTSRYLRDVYDSIQDSNYSETSAQAFYHFFDVLAEYPGGNDDHQHEEPFDFFGFVDSRDGRDQADFRYNAFNNYSASFPSYPQLDHNCGD